jgi:hypothetical protein
MGFFDWLFGRKREQKVQQSPTSQQATQQSGQAQGSGQSGQQLSDEQALARYRYMLQTAPPDQIEQAHAEAFAKLTPQQRALALQQLSQALPESERRAYTSDDPRTLARMATRAEMRQPGTIERSFGGVGMGGIGMGGMLAGSLMSSLAGAFIGTAIANQFFDQSADVGAEQDLGAEQDVGAEQDLAQDEVGGFEDGGGFDDAGGDFGGDF